MNEIRFTLEGTRDLDRKLQRASDEIATRAVSQATLAAGTHVSNLAVQKIVSQSFELGQLANSTQARPIDADRNHAVVEVGPSAEHGLYVEYGTGVYGTGPGASRQPITIRPRTKKALFWTGAAHPVRQVTIQGMRPRPFLRPAFDEGRGEALQIMRDTLRESLRGAVR